MAQQVWSEILNQQEMVPGVFLLELFAPEIAGIAQPGQFVHVRCSQHFAPLLRRPLSLHGVNPKTGQIALLYQVKGLGTRALAEKRPGEKLDLLGPLGKGFSLDPEARNIMVVGGGMGVAPLLPLAEMLKERGQKPTVILGFNTSSQVLRLAEFENSAQELFLVTRDGSAGEKGLVTAPLQRELAQNQYHLIYACGPQPMLQAVAEAAERFGVKCQVSLEAYMACGLGACLGCVCKIKDRGQEGYARVCVEGPVFDSQVVVWHG